MLSLVSLLCVTISTAHLFWNSDFGSTFVSNNINEWTTSSQNNAWIACNTQFCSEGCCASICTSGYYTHQGTTTKSYEDIIISFDFYGQQGGQSSDYCNVYFSTDGMQYSTVWTRNGAFAFSGHISVPLPIEATEQDNLIITLYNGANTEPNMNWCYFDNIVLNGTKKTTAPTKLPTEHPTFGPTKVPVIPPTYSPTDNPTNNPTIVPTIKPTNAPTVNPTSTSTYYPSQAPTKPSHSTETVVELHTTNPSDRLSGDHENEHYTTLIYYSPGDHPHKKLHGHVRTSIILILIVTFVLFACVIGSITYYLKCYRKRSGYHKSVNQQVENDYVQLTNGLLDDSNTKGENVNISLQLVKNNSHDNAPQVEDDEDDIYEYAPPTEGIGGNANEGEHMITGEADPMDALPQTTGMDSVTTQTPTDALD